MNLYIDTSDRKRVEVGLLNKGRRIDSLTEQNEFGSQVLLPLIDKLLKKHNLKYSDLKGIKVETGPGSFTGIRVGVTVANALAYSLKIPVNGKTVETELSYDV